MSDRGSSPRLRKTHVRSEYAGLSEEERFDICRDRLKRLSKERQQRYSQKQRTQTIAEARSRNGVVATESQQNQQQYFWTPQQSNHQQQFGSGGSVSLQDDWGEDSMPDVHPNDFNDGSIGVGGVGMGQNGSGIGFMGKGCLFGDGESIADQEKLLEAQLQQDEAESSDAKDLDLTARFSGQWKADLESVGLWNGATQVTYYLLEALEQEVRGERDAQLQQELEAQFGEKPASAREGELRSFGGFRSAFQQGSTAQDSGSCRRATCAADEEYCDLPCGQRQQLVVATHTDAEWEHWQSLGVV